MNGLPGWYSDKNPPDNAGDAGLILGGGGNGNPLQYSCLDPKDREGL